MNVDGILRAKGRDVTTIGPDATVARAAQELRRAGVGALVVSRDGARVEGVVAERDIVYGIAREGAAVLDKPVREVMSRGVPTCTPEDRIPRVMAVMTRSRVRHLPVLDGSRLCGIVSIGDVVKNRLDEAELEVRVVRDAYLTRH